MNLGPSAWVLEPKLGSMQRFFGGAESSDSSEEEEPAPLRTPVHLDLNNDGNVDVVLTPDQIRSLVLERHMALQAPVVAAAPPAPVAPVLVQPPTVVYQAPRVPPSKVPRGRWVWVPRSKLNEQAARRMTEMKQPMMEAATQIPSPAALSSASLQPSTQSQLPTQSAPPPQPLPLPQVPSIPSTQSAVPMRSTGSLQAPSEGKFQQKFQETFQSMKASPNYTPRSEVPYHSPYGEIGCRFVSSGS
ncbi:unnamed protein product [Effrenium voratum]|nr:unnamed protein product [Effrenium voratum]